MTQSHVRRPFSRTLRFVAPNAVTALSILCAVMAVQAALRGEIVTACWWVTYSTLTDKLDGLVARAVKGSSPLGVQMDSLADLLNYGFVPAAITYGFFQRHPDIGGWGHGFAHYGLMLICFAYALCAALRLARFNVSAGNPNFFFGVPSTFSGAIVVADVLLAGHRAPIWDLDWSPAGDRLVTASTDGVMRLWRRDGWALAGETRIGAAKPYIRLHFDRSGDRITIANGHPEVHVWEVIAARGPVVLGRHDAGAETARWSPDGSRVISSSADRTARIWDAHSGQLLTTLQSGFGIVYSARYSPDSTRIVTASDDDTARVWDTHTGKLLLMLQQAHTSVTTARFSPDGARIVSAGFRDDANVWDAHSGRLLFTLTGHTDRVSKIGRAHV